MRKHLLTLIILTIGSAAIAQKKEKDTAKIHLPIREGIIFYEKIIDSIPGSSRDAIFTTSLKWMAETFNDSKEVIQLKDKEQGIITGTGNFVYFVPGFIGESVRTGFLIDISVKDTKSRIRLYQFTDNFLPSYSSAMAKIPIEKNYLLYLSQTRFPRENKKRYQLFEENVKAIINSYATFVKARSKSDDF
jgi:hypothetical protein